MDGQRTLASLSAALRRPTPPAVGAVLGAWLEVAGEIGAGAWLGREGAGWRTLAASGPGSRSAPAEAPDGLAWDLLAGAREQQSFGRLGAAELRAYPALMARAVREAAWLVGEGGRRALWLDASTPGRLERAGMRALFEVLETIEELSARAAQRAGSEQLERRARVALGTQHDLRNQLSLALLELERAELEAGSDRRGLRRALEGALDLARRPLADRGAFPEPGAQPATVLVRPLLAEELRAAARLEDRAGAVRLLLRCPRELACRGPERELRRWVQNGLLNALRASSAGGSVRVVGEPCPGGGIRIAIEDEGRGMAPDEARRLFQPGTSDSGGTGHGTTALLEAARILGGGLELETALGKGTRLRLELPGPLS